jgi:F-box/leucine-rich repeat protein 10/11
LPRLCWYVGDKYLRDLKGGVEIPPRVLSSISALAEFLVSEARVLERGTESAKKELSEQVPSDRVKDPSAMARELRWRVNQAAGYSSEDESRPTNGVNGKSMKRKRRNSDTPSLDGPVKFKNFRPRLWDHISEPGQKEEERAGSAMGRLGASRGEGK